LALRFISWPGMKWPAAASSTRSGCIASRAEGAKSSSRTASRPH
jgi:hypothetical protein